MRSLADDLRSRTDDELAALLRARPDLAHPVPADLGALAQRAGSPASVGARLHSYDELALQLLLLCALAEEPLSLGPITTSLAAAAGGQLSVTDARRLVRDAVALFRRDALLWGSPRALHVVGAVRELLIPFSSGPLIAGVDPVVAGYVRDPSSLSTLVTTMPGAARGALDRLLERPVTGLVMNPRRTPEAARSGVDWLLTHHLVVPFGSDRVVVPGEVVQLLAPGSGSRGPARRRDRGLRVPQLHRPRPNRQVLDPQRAESGTVGTLLDILHAVDEIGHLWAEEPPSRLRAGGVSARDLTRTGRLLGGSEGQTCLILEVAAAAGLLANDNRERSTVLPTPAFDAWRAQPPPLRMAQLLIAWRDMPREIGTAVGETARPLSDDLLAPHLPALRREVLDTLAADDGDWSAEELLDALRWRAPRLDWAAREPDVLEILGQLRSLGVLVGGWLTSGGRALASLPPTAPGSDPGSAARGSGHPGDSALSAVAAALAGSLPAEVDSVIVQGDLTAVVPGLPSTGLADLLRRTARAESRGAASVYRFSPESIRTALDEGDSAGKLIAELERYGPVPQPLAYLITDTARTHAALRVGAAATYLRCEDAAVLAAILADPRAAGLGLFALSDTVAASSEPPEHVLERLASLGHHPVPDPGRGLAIAPVRRARGSRPTATEAGSQAMTGAMAHAVVRALRAAEPDGSRIPVRGRTKERTHAELAGRPGGRPPGPRSQASQTGQATRAGQVGQAGTPDSHTDTDRVTSTARVTGAADLLAALRDAIGEERRLTLDYVSPAGIGTSAEVVPLAVTGGYLTALTVPAHTIETYSLARISGVEAIALPS